MTCAASSASGPMAADSVRGHWNYLPVSSWTWLADCKRAAARRCEISCKNTSGGSCMPRPVTRTYTWTQTRLETIQDQFRYFMTYGGIRSVYIDSIIYGV